MCHLEALTQVQCTNPVSSLSQMEKDRNRSVVLSKPVVFILPLCAPSVLLQHSFVSLCFQNGVTEYCNSGMLTGWFKTCCTSSLSRFCSIINCQATTSVLHSNHQSSLR